MLLFAEFDDTTWKVIATTALLSGFSVLALPGGVLLDQERALALGWANLILSGSALTVALLLLWSESASDEWGRFFAALVAAAVASAQAATTTSRRRDDDTPSVRVLYAVGVGGAVLVAALVSLAAWQKIEDEGYYRFLGALAVATLLVTVLQPILRRAGKGMSPSEARYVAVLEDGDEVDVPPGLAAAIGELGAIVRIERR